MRFYTWAHDINHKQIAGLKDSAGHYGIEINYIETPSKSFNTTREKIRMLYDEVCKLKDEEIVCVVDAFDVFFCGGADEIEKKFLSLGCDCLVGAERAYSHQYIRYKKFYDCKGCRSPYRYVNAGTVIGYAGALRRVYAPKLLNELQARIFTLKVLQEIKNKSIRLKKLLRLKKFNEYFIFSKVYYADQQYISKYIATDPVDVKIKLDHYTELFWCCAHEWADIDKHFKIEDKKIINTHTNNAPLIVHVPGWMEHKEVLIKLKAIQDSLVQ